MTARHKRKRKKPGTPPGTVVYTGIDRFDSVQMELIEYDATSIQRKHGSLSELVASIHNDKMSWINVIGVHDVDALHEIGSALGLHALILEDVANTEQRPKLDVLPDHIFLAIRMLRPASSDLQSEQVCLIIGSNYLLSFQEHEGDVFDPIRERLNNINGRMRKNGPDYLAYAILDTIVDHYQHTAHYLGETIEELDERLAEQPNESIMRDIQSVKKKVLKVRRMALPLRDIIQKLVNCDAPHITPFTHPFLRDLDDHAHQLADAIDSYRDMLNDMTDLYLSLMSHKMNEIMKFLTIVGTIFIPLTFVVGVYGMNFEHMPELHSKLGYPITMIGMALAAVALLIYFRSRDWL